MELTVKEIHKSYKTVTVLDGASFSLANGEKVGLIGYNGTGKTTLLQIIAGMVRPDSGEVEIIKGAVVGYMPQDTSLASDESIRDYLKRVSGMASLEACILESAEALSEYERRGGYAFDHRVEVILAGFGLLDVSAERKIS